MQGRLRNYIEELLGGVEATEELQEFKYELVMNLCDKIDDLLANGLAEEEAFREAVATLGDLRAVFAERQDDATSVDMQEVYDSALCAGAFVSPEGPPSRSVPKTERSRKREKDYTGGLAVLSVAAYLCLGLLGVAGGFGVWWVLPIAAIGFGQLLAKEYSGAIMMITLALSCLLVMLKVLSSWWWVLALLMVATGIIAMVES